SIVIEPSSRRSLLPLGDGLLAAAQQRLGQLPHHIADRAGVHVGLGDGDLVSGAADDLIEHLDVGAQHFLDGVVHGAGGDHGRDHHGAVLADAVLAVLGLGDQVGQPFGLDEQGIGAAGQGDGDAGGDDIRQDHGDLAVLVVGSDPVAVGQGGLAVDHGMGHAERVEVLVEGVHDDLVDAPDDQRPLVHGGAALDETGRLEPLGDVVGGGGDLRQSGGAAQLGHAPHLVGAPSLHLLLGRGGAELAGAFAQVGVDLLADLAGGLAVFGGGDVDDHRRVELL